MSHTLLFLNPGHFHAALTLREIHPAVNEEIHVYAEEGPELRVFLDMVASFNGRGERPTRWRPAVYTGPDYMEKLISGRRGEIVIIAGKNDSKMAAINRLRQEGFHVLADKPWLIDVSGMDALAQATAAPPHVMDIMTGRFEITHLLPARLAGEPDIFGDFRADGGGPAISMDSVHHLYKIVNEKPLLRSAWYFDAAVQGDGIVDIPCHLVDKVLWLMRGEPVAYQRDVKLESARIWTTAVPPEQFARITGEPAYPSYLEKDLRDGVLEYACNGEFSFTLRGVSVRLMGEWRLEAPPGGGDTYQFLLRGSRADIAVETNAGTGFRPEVFIRPHDDPGKVEQALRNKVAQWEGEFPGLAVAPAKTGWRLEIPAALRTSHESHFPMVLNEFLGYLDRGDWPAGHAETLRTKYTLTAKASAMAWAGRTP